MLPPTPHNIILFELDFDVKFPLSRLLQFLSNLKSTIVLLIQLAKQYLCTQNANDVFGHYIIVYFSNIGIFGLSAVDGKRFLESNASQHDSRNLFQVRLGYVRWNHRTFQTRFQQNLSLSIKLGFKNTELGFNVLKH